MARLAATREHDTPAAAPTRPARRRSVDARSGARTAAGSRRDADAAAGRAQQPAARSRGGHAAHAPEGRGRSLQPVRRRWRRPVVRDRAPRLARQRRGDLEFAQPHRHARLREAGAGRTVAVPALRRGTGRDQESARASVVSGPRTLAIVNPAAGGGAGAKLARRLAHDLAAAGVSADVITTPALGEAARLAIAA